MLICSALTGLTLQWSTKLCVSVFVCAYRTNRYVYVFVHVFLCMCVSVYCECAQNTDTVTSPSGMVLIVQMVKLAAPTKQQTIYSNKYTHTHKHTHTHTHTTCWVCWYGLPVRHHGLVDVCVKSEMDSIITAHICYTWLSWLLSAFLFKIR